MKYRVILFDDDETIRATLQQCLTLDPEWEVFSSGSCREGLREIARARPDVVVLDYDFGDGQMTGFEFLRVLRRDPDWGRVPVLMLTGALVEIPDKVAGMELGADDYLVKPVSLPVLKARAKAAVLKARRARG